MQKEIEITLSPKEIKNYQLQKKLAAKKLRVDESEINAVRILRSSIDSRKSPVYRLRALAYINEEPVEQELGFAYKNVEDSEPIIIIGSGPAGMFAALKCLELDLKPIVLERGKNVRDRRFDLRDIQQDHIVNPDSNYCFGEGGAGTYSDGKLYTRSGKRGNIKRILEILVAHGAQKEILIDAHPHIGSNVLPKVVQNIRETILKFGGEFHFNSKVTDFIIRDKKIYGVIVNDEKEVLSNSVILATGHSARDIYQLCHKSDLEIEAKSFAMGVRIEHPQALIDEIQYGMKTRHENLPAASYSLTCQVGDKGVYSFCMCPGGIIIPASTSPGELVLNGMSVSRRDSKFANSGFVVAVDENDWKHHKSKGVFAGLAYQAEIERLAFNSGGDSQTAPAQRITDFMNGKSSSSLPESSYIPGTISKPIHEILPKNIVKGLRGGLSNFGGKMKGYFTEEAQILAAETRTSSPIRIPRDKETLMHLSCNGLYPCGEGAGYAGGIMSAAIDGERCAEAIKKTQDR